MPDEPNYNIGQGDASIAEHNKWELMRIYNSPEKCEGIWIEMEGSRKPLWGAISYWHGGRPLEEVLVRKEDLQRIPLLKLKANANEKPRL